MHLFIYCILKFRIFIYLLLISSESDRTTLYTPGCCNGSDKCYISILLSYFCKNLYMYNCATVQPHGVFFGHAIERKISIFDIR